MFIALYQILHSTCNIFQHRKKETAVKIIIQGNQIQNTLTPLHIYILFSPRIWRDIKIDGFGGEKCGKSADPRIIPIPA